MLEWTNNQLKQNKIYIGQELGNTECKIGLFRPNDINSKLLNSNNNKLILNIS